MIRRDKEDFLDDYNRLIDINVIKDVISEFEEDLNRLEKYKNYYVGKVNYQLPKELQGLLPNDLNVNFAKEIVDTATSYTFDKPVIYSDGGFDDWLKDWYGLIDEHGHNKSVVKGASIYGCNYELITMEDDLIGTDMPTLSTLSPLNTFLVEDNTPKHKPFIGVYFTIDNDRTGTLKGYNVYIYTKNYIYRAKGNTLKELHIISEEQHYFGGIPINRLKNNRECTNDFECVLGLIDYYNLIEIYRLSDTKQWTDKTLVLENSSMGDTEEERQQGLKMWVKDRLIELEEGGKAYYITAQIDENQIQVKQDNTKKLIHQIAKIPDLSSINVGANTSGVAMAYTQFDTEQLASAKETEFKKFLRRRLNLINNIMTLKNKSIDVANVNIKMKRNVPDNIDNNLKLFQATKDEVSLRTRYTFLNIEADYDEEMKYLEKETKMKASWIQSQYDNYDYNDTTKINKAREEVELQQDKANADKEEK